MKLAILHHHLNRGGVSQVIANHLRALATLPPKQRPERVVLFYDGQQDGWPDDPLHGSGAFPVDLVTVPALQYDTSGAQANPTPLAETLRATLAEQGLAPDDSLLHIHNHSLGKNASVPGALQRLADDGWRMLLQVHDFAEDNRPANYQHLCDAIGETDPQRLGEVLYPQASIIHYATLTERDAAILRTAGVVEDQLHPLPNPVADFGEMLPQQEAKARVFPQLGIPAAARLIVYPVRGIRRKNLGEMLLLSALAPEGTYFGVTLRPKNPVEAASFDRWRRLAESLDLPCLFDTGSPREEGGYGCDFKETLAAADAILTTSVAEGFGMVFLEAWLAGKPLIGRDLPEITREFKAAGMTFRGLWTELRAASHLDADFGRLTAQEQVVALRETARPETPIDLGIEATAADVAANAQVVREHYSLEHIGQRLQSVYLATLSAETDSASAFDAHRIVQHFSDPSLQHPIRFEVVPEEPMSELVATISRLSTPLEAQPTGESPQLASLPGIQAVVFDVYGTLLISGSGDISLASENSRGDAALAALQTILVEPEASATGVAPNYDVTPGADASGSPINGDQIVEQLHQAIHTAHEASSSDHPEVEIREIWQSVLSELDLSLSEPQIERLAVEYECHVNPIWPMPGLAETLNGLAQAKLKLGIVSNAQFFTPLAFGPLTGKSLAMWDFDPEVCIWSYEHQEAKPGTFLYERCAQALATHGIEPSEALFVGNDLRNDVWPAQRVGFKTALFAGDARSLRWRRDDERLSKVRPDAVVTDLRQLLQIVL